MEDLLFPLHFVDNQDSHADVDAGDGGRTLVILWILNVLQQWDLDSRIQT